MRFAEATVPDGTLAALGGVRRINLCPNPGLQVTNGGYTVVSGYSGSITQDSTHPYTGTVGGLYSDRALGHTGGAFNGPQVAIAPLQYYTVSLWLYCDSPAASWTGRIDLLPTGSQTGMTRISTASRPLQAGWQRLTATTHSSADAVTLDWQVYFGGLDNGQVVWFDAVLIENAATAGSYFDGDTPGHFWTGTTGASPSDTAALDCGGMPIAVVGDPTGNADLVHKHYVDYVAKAGYLRSVTKVSTATATVDIPSIQNFNNESNNASVGVTRCYWNARSNTTSASYNIGLYLTVNGDAGTAYKYQSVNYSASGGTSISGVSTATKAQVGYVVGSNAPVSSDTWSNGVITFSGWDGQPGALEWGYQCAYVDTATQATMQFGGGNYTGLTFPYNRLTFTLQSGYTFQVGSEFVVEVMSI